MKNGKLDAVDIGILKKLLDEGPSFLKHSAHVNRGYSLRSAGLVDNEMALYSVTHGGDRFETRPKFTITKKGRSALKTAVAGEMQR